MDRCMEDDTAVRLLAIGLRWGRDRSRIRSQRHRYKLLSITIMMRIHGARAGTKLGPYDLLGVSLDASPICRLNRQLVDDSARAFLVGPRGDSWWAFLF